MKWLLKLIYVHTLYIIHYTLYIIHYTLLVNRHGRARVVMCNSDKLSTDYAFLTITLTGTQNKTMDHGIR